MNPNKNTITTIRLRVSITILGSDRLSKWLISQHSIHPHLYFTVLWFCNSAKIVPKWNEFSFPNNMSYSNHGRFSLPHIMMRQTFVDKRWTSFRTVVRYSSSLRTRGKQSRSLRGPTHGTPTTTMTTSEDQIIRMNTTRHGVVTVAIATAQSTEAHAHRLCHFHQ